MNIDEILKTWKEFEKLTEQKYQSVFGDEFKLKMPSTGDKLKLDPLKTKEPLAKKTVTPKTTAPDWESDVKADMAPINKPADRLKDTSVTLPVKVKDPSLRTKNNIRSSFRDEEPEFLASDADAATGRWTKKGKIARRFEPLKDTGFRFTDFYKAIQNPEMKDIRKILGRKDRRFGRRHGKAMKAYVAKVGSFEASRNLGVDELSLKKMFGPKGKRKDPKIKNWARTEGGALRVPDKFIQKATNLAVKSGALSPEQAKTFLEKGLRYDPRTGKTAGWDGDSYGGRTFGGEAVSRLAALYAIRGYNVGKHREKTGHAFSPIGTHELSDKIKYLKSKIKGGKTSATEAGEGGDYKGKWKRDFGTAQRLMKDFGSLAAWKRFQNTDSGEGQKSLSPRVHKMFSKMSLDQTLGSRALNIAKDSKYTLEQLINMRKNKSGPEGLKVSAKMRRKQALLDRAIALRQGAAAGQRRVKLPGGLVDFDTEGILTK